jgi:hypothetical protein
MPSLQTFSQEFEQKMLKEKLQPLVTQEVIEEHKLNPIGKHSDQLEKLLFNIRKYHPNLRLNQQKGRYVIICTKPHQEWCIGELSEVRGVPPKLLTEESFTSRQEAEHAVFLRRLKDFGFVEITS